MILNTRNDPAPGVPYAECNDCAQKLTTVEVAREHMSATMAPVDEFGVTARGHGISITNPTRTERVLTQVERTLQDAIDEALDDLQAAVSRGDLTSDELAVALKAQPEFLQDLQDWLE